MFSFCCRPQLQQAHARLSFSLIQISPICVHIFNKFVSNQIFYWIIAYTYKGCFETTSNENTKMPTRNQTILQRPANTQCGERERERKNPSNYFRLMGHRNLIFPLLNAAIRLCVAAENECNVWSVSVFLNGRVIDVRRDTFHCYAGYKCFVDVSVKRWQQQQQKNKKVEKSRGNKITHAKSVYRTRATAFHVHSHMYAIRSTLEVQRTMSVSSGNDSPLPFHFSDGIWGCCSSRQQCEMLKV